MKENEVPSNWDDYWLGVAALDNTSGQLGWVSVELVIRLMREREINAWTPADDEITSMIDNESQRGGGLMGSTPTVIGIRQGLIETGQEMRRSEGRVVSGDKYRRDNKNLRAGT
jgi:hypothetical protein